MKSLEGKVQVLCCDFHLVCCDFHKDIIVRRYKYYVATSVAHMSPASQSHYSSVCMHICIPDIHRLLDLLALYLVMVHMLNLLCLCHAYGLEK